MKRSTRMLTVAAMLAFSPSAHATALLTVAVDGLENNKPVPEANARCLPTPDGKSSPDGKNQRPAIHWSNAPKGTQSYAIFVMDPDVPADFSDAGKAGKVIAADAKRQDFFHFALIDLPLTASMLPTGEALNGGTPLRNDMGKNKYVPTEAEYGGPCPPWNDARLHHYHYMVMALDIPHISEIPGIGSAEPSAKTGYDALKASPHVLAKGEVVGTYTLNAGLRK